MRLSISDIHQDTTLATAAAGQAAFGEILKRISLALSPKDEYVFLDFSGATLATGSFLRALLLPLRDHCRRELKVALIVSNPNALVTEELHALLHALHDAIVVCKLGSDDTPRNPMVIGHLDETQRVTLNAVADAVETDAPSLAELYTSTNSIGPTGWNNRLVALSLKGLLTERRSGKTKRYRTVLEGLTHGT
jgi:hypothetical protein